MEVMKAVSFLIVSVSLCSKKVPVRRLALHTQVEGSKSYLLRDSSLVVQIFAQPLHNLYLFFNGEPDNGCFDNATDGLMVDSDEALVVHVCEKPHDELAVHTVCHASMARNAVAEVFDLERSFES